MLEQFLACRLLGEHPVVEFEDAVARAEMALEVALAVVFIQHLLGREVAQELLHIVVGALPGEKLAGRDVEQADAAGRLVEVYGRQEVVFLVAEHVVAHGHARRDELGDASLHHLVHLGEAFLAFDGLAFLLGVFQLVADGHAPPGPDELGQVGVEGMVGEPRHRRLAAVAAVVALGEGDAQDAGSHHGIVAVGLVEVAAAEEQQGVGMLGLHREELPHHGGHGLILG